MAKKKAAKRIANSRVAKSKVSKKSPSKAAKKKASKKSKRTLVRCYDCLEEYLEGQEHDCVPLTERDLIDRMEEDFREAYLKLKDIALSFGEQRSYNNARAIMFSRRVCYMFVRPKKSFLELVFFLPDRETDIGIHSVQEVSKTKFAHTVRLVHSDQVEEPLTDWLRRAYDFST